MYRRHSGPVDWLRRTAWFVRTSTSYRVIVALTLASLAASAASLVTSSSTWLVVGLLSLAASGAAFVLDWAAKAREAGALYSTAVTPVDHVYDAPYRDWPEVRLPGDLPGLRFAPDLDEQLRRERPAVTVRRQGSWTPSGPAHEVWRRWGGRRGQFVEPKIRLAGDLLPGATTVDVQETDYVAYVVTNGLADKVVHDRSRSLPDLRFDDVGLRLGVVPTLERSGCSNHIGGDLLLIGDGRLWLHQQNHRNLVQPGALAVSASGSFDWDLDLVGADDLLTVVKNGLLRELEEELNLPPAAVPAHDDVRVVRYGRASYTGGKPQFFAIARSRSAQLARRRGRGDRFTEDILPVDFSVPEGLGGVVAALEAAAAGHRDVSRPYLVLVATLRELVRTDDPLCRWAFFKDESPA